MQVRTIDEFCTIIKSALETDQEIGPTSVASDVDKWDSLGQIMILAALDEYVPGILDMSEDFKSTTSVVGLWDLWRKFAGTA